MIQVQIGLDSAVPGNILPTNYLKIVKQRKTVALYGGPELLKCPRPWIRMNYTPATCHMFPV
jgi:hypothetical protein